MTAVDYSNPSYWDERYATEDHFEWLGAACNTRLVEHLCSVAADKSAPTLVLGCGSSSLSADLHAAGFSDVLSTDISAVCVRAQADKHRDKPGLRWQVADMTALPFEDASFDLVVEKATIDALLANEPSPWRLSDETEARVAAALASISRVMRPGARFVSVSFGQPHFRLNLYARPEFSWGVRHHTFHDEGAFHFYLYEMTKGEKLDLESIEKLLAVRNVKHAVMDASDSEDDEGFITKVNL